MTDLTELLTRVEAATGPDRELDEEIFSALDLAPKTFFDSAVVSHSIRSRVVNTADGKLHLDAFEIGRYTASLDAALALVGEKLSGEYIDIGGLSIPAPTAEPDWQATIGPWLGGGLTPALALLSALLRALIAKKEW